MIRSIKWLTGMFLMLGWLSGSAADLKAGDPAPHFALQDQDGEQHRLQDYAGRWLVVYFYPKNDTPGCTREACEFRDDVFQFGKLNVGLLGISLDDIESHRRFAEKYSLPFPLLSDAEGRVAEAYGSLFSLGPLKFAKRHSFIIDPASRIARVYRDVDPKSHSDQVIADVQRLMAATAR